VTTSHAKALRNNPTEAERFLWSMLRRKQLAEFRFRRQVPIGPYVADFVCLSARLIVEVDGGQHGRREAHDRKRTVWLESQNFRVMRFWNNEILGNDTGVLEMIMAALKVAPAAMKRASSNTLRRRESPPPQPSPVKGEGADRAAAQKSSPPLRGRVREGGSNRTAAQQKEAASDEA